MQGDPLAKIVRSYQHVQELAGLIQSFADESYRVDMQQDFREPDSQGDIIIYAEAVRNPPSELWSPIIGEVVFDLRSALDQVVWTLSVEYQASLSRFPPLDPMPWGSPWRRVNFPILTSSDPKRWRGAEQKKLWAVDPTLLAQFQALQPSVSGQGAPEREPLAVLDELCNIDKHRHLHLINTTVELHDVLTVNPLPDALSDARFPLGTFEVVSRRDPGPLIGRTEIGRAHYVPVPGGILAMSLPEMHMNPRLVIDVAFDQGPPAHGGRVLKVLSDLGQAVQEIVAAF